MIRKFFGGSQEISVDMYERTFKKLSEGISTGYGTPKDAIDADMVYHLKNNTKVFAAFKANHYKETMRSLLVDQDNTKRSWGDFLKEAKKVDADYNTNWLAAEYNMATRQARGAQQWNGFRKDKDTYPNLQYMASRSANPREVHQKYYGMILPIDHPFWSTGYPPIDWGCKCWVKQTREEPTEGVSEDDIPSKTRGLAGNAAIEKKVFTATSSYLRGVTKEDKDLVKEFLIAHRALGYEKIVIPVGKNKLTYPTDADSSGLIQNIDYIQLFVKKYKEDYGINSHRIGAKIKNPEYHKGTIIGDLTTWENSKTAKGFIETNWVRKYKVQLKNFDEIFIAFDFNGRLTKDNYMEMWKTLNGKMDLKKEKNRCKFVLLKNGDKITKIMNDENRKSEGLGIIEKELL